MHSSINGRCRILKYCASLPSVYATLFVVFLFLVFFFFFGSHLTLGSI